MIDLVDRRAVARMKKLFGQLDQEHRAEALTHLGLKESRFDWRDAQIPDGYRFERIERAFGEEDTKDIAAFLQACVPLGLQPSPRAARISAKSGSKISARKHETAVSPDACALSIAPWQFFSSTATSIAFVWTSVTTNARLAARKAVTGQYAEAMTHYAAPPRS